MNDYIKREDAENKLAKIITGDIFREFCITVTRRPLEWEKQI